MKKEVRSFSEIVLINFIILKLAGLIAWSWIWVLSPIWILLGASVILYVVAFTIKYFCYPDELNKKPPAKSHWQERVEEMQREQLKSRAK